MTPRRSRSLSVVPNDDVGGVLGLADMLADFAERLDLARDEHGLHRVLLDRVREVLGPAHAALLLVNDATHEFELVATRPTRYRAWWAAEIEAHIEAGTFAFAVNQRQPLALPCRTTDCPVAGVQSLVLAPLVVGYRPLGLFAAGTSWSPEALPSVRIGALAVLAKQFGQALNSHRLIAALRSQNDKLASTSAELRAHVAALRSAETALRRAVADEAARTQELERLQASLAATVLERTTELRQANERLELLARTDGLTGLLNRRSFQERLDDEEARWRRYQRPTSVAMVDVNGLKTVNDRFGHGAGDIMLGQVAELIRTCVRRTDIVARIGGDEFAIIMRETDEAGAHLLVERLMRDVQGTAPTDRSVEWSVAVGSASCPPHQSLEQALSDADRAMYRVKVEQYAERGGQRQLGGPSAPC